MSTTSSSRRKPRTTASSRGAVVLVALLAAACGGPRETFVTYFSGDHGVSLRYPATWRTDQAEQDGVFHRYFLAPPGPQGRSPVSVTFLAGALAVPLEEYARTYLADHPVASSRPEERQGLSGRSWAFADASGARRYRLLLVALEGRVVGLYAQGDAAAVERNGTALDEMWSSFGVERPDRYPITAWTDQRASLGIPASWRETRRFSGGRTLVTSYVTPALAVDGEGHAVHASLSVTFEAIPEGEGLGAYYEASRRRLGENFQVSSHAAFRGGYVDVMRTETPVAISFVKRFYFADGPRGCSLTFEAREDVFPRVSRWADYVASTLRFGGVGGAAR
jgi:hypothetical protein